MRTILPLLVAITAHVLLSGIATLTPPKHTTAAVPTLARADLPSSQPAEPISLAARQLSQSSSALFKNSVSAPLSVGQSLAIGGQIVRRAPSAARRHLAHTLQGQCVRLQI